MSGWIQQLKKLKELRVLQFQYLRIYIEPTPNHWQKGFCEALQKGGCSELTTIQFSYKVVWTRHPDDLSWKCLTFR
jgi:hypothetical protein